MTMTCFVALLCFCLLVFETRALPKHFDDVYGTEDARFVLDSHMHALVQMATEAGMKDVKLEIKDHYNYAVQLEKFAASFLKKIYEKNEQYPYFFSNEKYTSLIWGEGEPLPGQVRYGALKKTKGNIPYQFLKLVAMSLTEGGFRAPTLPTFLMMDTLAKLSDPSCAYWIYSLYAGKSQPETTESIAEKTGLTSGGSVEDFKACVALLKAVPPPFRVLTWNIYNGYRARVDIRQGTASDAAHSDDSFRNEKELMRLINVRLPTIFGLQEVSLVSPSAPTAYMTAESLKGKFSNLGYDVFSCQALTIQDHPILWNYIGVKKSEKVSINGEAYDAQLNKPDHERRCMIGVGLTIHGIPVSAATSHLAWQQYAVSGNIGGTMPYSSWPLNRPFKGGRGQAESPDGRWHTVFEGEVTETKNMVADQADSMRDALDAKRGSSAAFIFGDFNHEPETFKDVLGTKYENYQSPDLTGLRGKKRIDQIWFSKESGIVPYSPGKRWSFTMEAPYYLSDHSAVEQSFSLSGEQEAAAAAAAATGGGAGSILASSLRSTVASALAGK